MTEASWEADIRRLHSDARGALQLILITPEEVVELMLAGLAGDASATTYIRALGAYLRQLNGSNEPTFCLTCDDQLAGVPLLIGLVIPARNDATISLGIGLCAGCCSKHQDRGSAETAIIGALRSKVWPDLRRIETPPQAHGAI